MVRSPRAAVKAPRIMGKVYRIILDGMVARGWQAPRQRVRVSRLRIAFILLCYAIV
jgi:phytoene synthase